MLFYYRFVDIARVPVLHRLQVSNKPPLPHHVLGKTFRVSGVEWREYRKTLIHEPPATSPVSHRTKRSVAVLGLRFRFVEASGDVPRQKASLRFVLCDRERGSVTKPPSGLREVTHPPPSRMREDDRA